RVVEDAADAVASQEAADESADDRADDTQDDRHPEAHGLLARHDGAGDEADDRADDDPGDDCPEKTHERNSVLSGEGIGGAVASMAAHSPKSPYRRQNRWSRSRPCGPQGRSDSSRGTSAPRSRRGNAERAGRDRPARSAQRGARPCGTSEVPV